MLPTVAVEVVVVVGAPMIAIVIAIDLVIAEVWLAASLSEAALSDVRAIRPRCSAGREQIVERDPVHAWNIAERAGVGVDG